MSSTRRLLGVWEALRSNSPARRAIALAEVDRPASQTKRVAEWSVGARDAALMRLRSVVFGANAQAVGVCPECGEQIEFELDLDRLRTIGADESNEEAIVDEDGWTVTSRLPRASDLVAIESAASAELATEMLWERCVSSVSHEGCAAAVENLPPSVRSSVAERWEQLDPLAEVRLDLACPACEALSQQTFDIASYVWVEVDSWARRLLADVHLLACAYGWSEDEILELSPLRRRCYLEMVVA